MKNDHYYKFDYRYDARYHHGPGNSVEGWVLTMHDREKLWRTADGRHIAVKDMELSHLVNVVNWILDNSLSYPAHVRDLMIAEANYRQIFLFAQGETYPQRVGARWQMIDPKTGQGRIEKPPADYIEAVKENEAYQEMSKKTRKKRQNEKHPSL